MLPGPMEYLKSHAIAFVAGALTVAVIQVYTSLRRPAPAKAGAPNKVL